MTLEESLKSEQYLKKQISYGKRKPFLITQNFIQYISNPMSSEVFIMTNKNAGNTASLYLTSTENS
jgi:hypothetical protein